MRKRRDEVINMIKGLQGELRWQMINIRNRRLSVDGEFCHRIGPEHYKVFETGPERPGVRKGLLEQIDDVTLFDHERQRVANASINKVGGAWLFRKFQPVSKMSELQLGYFAQELKAIKKDLKMRMKIIREFVRTHGRPPRLTNPREVGELLLHLPEIPRTRLA
jgi:hypothetical protein